jgi:hypothetical protein
MNHLSRKLNAMEEKASKLFNPSYEEHICSYLKLVFDRDRDEKQLKEQYQKVSKTVAKMH